MKKVPEGWVIYSVGKNLKDDGGQVADQADAGLGPVPRFPRRKLLAGWHWLCQCSWDVPLGKPR